MLKSGEHKTVYNRDQQSHGQENADMNTTTISLIENVGQLRELAG